MGGTFLDKRQHGLAQGLRAANPNPLGTTTITGDEQNSPADRLL